jgi:dienelactone hydrolase
MAKPLSCPRASLLTRVHRHYGKVARPNPPAGAPLHRARFEAVTLALPVWGAASPHRCAYLGGVSGATQLFFWDRSRDLVRQVTTEPFGVARGLLDPGGTRLWWFALDGSGETGRWRTARAAGGRAADALPLLPSGHPEGLALAANGTVAAAVSAHRGGTTLCIAPGGQPDDAVVRHFGYPVYVGGIAPDGSAVLLVHAEHGDPRRPALRVLATDGEVVARLDDWPAGGIDVSPYGQPFHPGGQWILAIRERDGYRQPLHWDWRSGADQDIDTGLAGDMTAAHTPAGDALLLHRRWHGRSELYRYPLSPPRSAEPLTVPPGTVHAAASRPDGDVWCLHSAWAQPPSVLSLREGPLLAPPAGFPASHPLRELWVPGPGGPVHVFLTTPRDAERPSPCVFLLHGGPAEQDGDEYRPDVEAWADRGFLVVRVNYRGSSGYGMAWRRANHEAVGHAEIADIAAVRAALIAEHLIDPGQCVLSGGSWGGYLALLAVSLQPGQWACAIAESPITDFATAYDDRMEELRAVDRALFGGTPEQVPGRYREASPLTYADQVSAPVMIIFGERDPRCPPRQIENYIDALRSGPAAVEVIRHQGGHGVREVAGLAGQLERQQSFAARHLRPQGSPAPAPRS